MKREDREIINHLNDIDQSKIEKLAKDIYGGDKYDREISKEDLENMRGVFTELHDRIDGKNDKQSTIEKMVLKNNIKLIDAEMQRRDCMDQEVNMKTTSSTEEERKLNVQKKHLQPQSGEVKEDATTFTIEECPGGPYLDGKTSQDINNIPTDKTTYTVGVRRESLDGI